MLAAVKGRVQGNTVLIEDEDIRAYDGTEVIVTLLNYPKKKDEREVVDWDSFAVPSERGQNVDEYMKEIYFVFPYRNKSRDCEKGCTDKSKL